MRMHIDARAAAERLKGLDVRALAGSACLWSWVDALYMGAFFTPAGQRAGMAEAATWATFLLVVPLSVLYLWKADTMRRAISCAPLLVGMGVAGSVASALFALSEALQSPALLGLGAVLGAFFMGTAILGWGAVYCADGVRSAALYVAGGFACALVPDVTFMLMAPLASAIAPMALPLLSGVLLLMTPREIRTYGTTTPASSSAPAGTPASATPVPPAGAPTPARRGIAGRLRLSLGISIPVLLSLSLIMLGLGYMQHQVSFAELPGLTNAGGAGAIMQVVRGLVSLVVFVAALLAPSGSRVVYRVGLLAIVAGYSLMPLLAGSERFWVSGAVILSGYTTFDVLVWIIVAQAAYARLADPLHVVIGVRMLVSSLFCGLGGLAGIATSTLAHAAPFPYADAIFVGYLMTVGVVLVISGRDVWDLFDARPVPASSLGSPWAGAGLTGAGSAGSSGSSGPAGSPVPADASSPDAATPGSGGASSLAAAIDTLATQWALTSREREVFALLAVGRTQPWVAEHLGISESTVNSHVRHIYAKAGVNSRQGMLDLVFRAQSPESVERGA